MRLAPVVLLVGAAIGATLASPAAFAQARIYCCDDAQGRKVCGDFLPTECVRRAYEERDQKGFVVKQVEAPMSPEQIARREAEQKKKEEETRRKTEERRRNLALLSTYSSEKDVDNARDRAIAEISKHVEQAEKQLAEAMQALKKAESEREFYKNKPLPATVKKQITDATAEAKAKQDNLNERKLEVEKTHQKFEEEKKKWRELKGIVSPGPALVTPLPTAEAAAQTPPAAAPAPGQPGAQPAGQPSSVIPAPAPANAPPGPAAATAAPPR